MLQATNDQGLCTMLQQSFEEYDISMIKNKLKDRFSYTGEQMTAFETEWVLSYNDWYSEHCPIE